MKNRLMTAQDRKLLHIRGVIESVIDILKNICNIEHSRHRSPLNAMVSVVGGLLAYSFLDTKPSIKKKNMKLRDFMIENKLDLSA